MAIERKWAALPDNPLTADGTSDGRIQVANANNYRVNQLIILKSSTQTSVNLRISRIVGSTISVRSDKATSIEDRADVSAFLVADSASILLPEQDRSKIASDQVIRATYEEDPVMAQRSILVDDEGNLISNTNPIPVNIISGGGGPGGGGETEPYLTYQLNEFEDNEAGTLYIGKANPDGLWLVERIIETGASLSKKYANISNNGSITTFATAWTNRATLIYTDFQNITGL